MKGEFLKLDIVDFRLLFFCYVHNVPCDFDIYVSHTQSYVCIVENGTRKQETTKIIVA